MRQERIIQANIFDVFAPHEIGRELKAISEWLDGQGELFSLVAADSRQQEIKDTGRHGIPAEAVLRCGMLKQQRQLCYEELAFHLEDSSSFRAFARLPLSSCPKKSVLHKTISAIRAETWEEINRALLRSARKEKVECGTMVRIDSTVSEALLHEPSDSSLLWDAVRVMVRLLGQASTLPGGEAISWRNHRRLAKRRAQAIKFGGRAARKKLYRELIAATRATVASLRQAAQQPLVGIEAELWCAEVEHYLPLIERIIDQSQRRVLAGEAGNPADAERFLPMLDRHVALYGTPPCQSAADGGFASLKNLERAKAMGVRDVAFHKKCGLTIEKMVKSRWVYRKLRNFRAGIEAGISCLKRAYGLGRCTWRGLNHFKAYVWSSVVAYNLAIFSRLRPA